MSRQLEQQRETVQAKLDLALVAAVEFELEGAVAHAGGELVGLSLRITRTDVLMTLRAVLPGGRMVAFVGGATMPDCFRRAVNDAYQDRLRWRDDHFVKE